MTEASHGTTIAYDRGRPVRAVDRHGHEIWRATWDSGRLSQLVVRRPDRSALVLDGDGGEHPLFGPVHAIRRAGETERLASCGAVDWAAPRFVPPIDRPAAIPAGGGSAILNVLALQAGSTPLRYRGPYPTAALFDALLQSFTVDDPPAALRRFTAGVEDKALAGAMEVVDVELVPAPHAWAWPAPGVCVQLRDGVERVFVDGSAHDRMTASHRQLVPVDEGWSATVFIADEPWCERVRVAADGALIDGPRPLPPVDSPLLDATLPDEIGDVLAQVVASRAPRLLAPAIERTLHDRRLVWADTGDALARLDDTTLHLHALLGERLEEASPGRVLALLVEAVEPIARRAAQAHLAHKALH